MALQSFRRRGRSAAPLLLVSLQMDAICRAWDYEIIDTRDLNLLSKALSANARAIMKRTGQQTMFSSSHNANAFLLILSDYHRQRGAEDKSSKGRSRFFLPTGPLDMLKVDDKDGERRESYN
jgi:hypothetical protein